MELSDVLRRRRMVRHFTDEPVAAGAVERIVAAGLRAPSAGYSQGCSMLLIESEEDRDRLWATHTPTEAGWAPEVLAGIKRAPVLIALLTSKDVYLDRYARADKGWTDRDEARWPVPYWHVDAGCMAMLLLLQAIDERLGALLFGIVPDDIPAFRAAFGVPADVDVVGVVAVGHPDPDAPRRDLSDRKRPQADVVHRGRW